MDTRMDKSKRSKRLYIGICKAGEFKSVAVSLVRQGTSSIVVSKSVIRNG